MPSSRRTDEILKSQVSFRSDKDGIEVKVTETMEVEVDVTVAPLDGRLRPPGLATASSSATILSSNASTTKEPGNGLPQSPANRLALRSRAQSGYVPGHSRTSQCQCGRLIPGRHHGASGFAISSLGLPRTRTQRDDCQQPA